MIVDIVLGLVGVGYVGGDKEDGSLQVEVQQGCEQPGVRTPGAVSFADGFLVGLKAFEDLGK